VSGGSNGGGAAVSSSDRAACRAYMEANCKRNIECGARYTFESCTALERFCPDYFTSPGSTRTASSLLACAAVWATRPCEDVATKDVPPCSTRGTRKVGEACSFGPQCESGACSTRSQGGCGTCIPVVAPGAACDNYVTNACPSYQTCSGGTCVPVQFDTPKTPLPADAKCNPDYDVCANGYGCQKVPGATSDYDATCRPMPGPGLACAAGQKCAKDAYCDSNNICVAVAAIDAPCTPSQSVECVAAAYCDDGDVCRARKTAGVACNSDRECVEGAHCKAAASGDERCFMVREEGQPCSDTYDECAAGLSCTSGTCRASGLLGFFATCSP
jgi:hypothetical protein